VKEVGFKPGVHERERIKDEEEMGERIGESKIEELVQE